MRIGLVLALSALAIGEVARPINADQPVREVPASPSNHLAGWAKSRDSILLHDQTTPEHVASPMPLLPGHDTDSSQVPLLQFSFGQRTWLSRGQTDYNFVSPSAIDDLLVNTLTDLRWDHLVSTIVEFNGDVVLYERCVASATIGFGAIGDGILRDQDIVFDGNGNRLFSIQSLSQVDDDDLFYVNIDLGYRLPASPGSLSGQHVDSTLSLDLLVGYQYWRERYVARDGTQFVETNGFRIFESVPPGIGITEHFRWHSFRVGARANLELLGGFSTRTRLMVVPWTRYEQEDIHHLRTDLRQDPSFEDRADGGWGIMFDATLSYRVWGGLALEAGYQIWDITSRDRGVTTARPLVGGQQSNPVNKANMTRQGIILGLYYAF